jgi:hypothetical protein
MGRGWRDGAWLEGLLWLKRHQAWTVALCRLIKMSLNSAELGQLKANQLLISDYYQLCSCLELSHRLSGVRGLSCDTTVLGYQQK